MCVDCGCHETASKNESFSIEVSEKIQSKNLEISEKNLAWFKENSIKVVNIMSSPGSGKTSLLQAALPHLKLKNHKVLVGDQFTDRDAQRLKESGINAKQITTGETCHLNADMIRNEIGNYLTGNESLIIIENVGNLVCPSSFPLGESITVALLSVTEGEDKPLKYPKLFKNADLILITKTDLLPHLDWDESDAIENIKKVNPSAKILMLNTKDISTMYGFIDFLDS